MIEERDEIRMIELIDSHAHLDDEKFDSDREEIISKIKMMELKFYNSRI